MSSKHDNDDEEENRRKDDISYFSWNGKKAFIKTISIIDRLIIIR